jgi:hypothetical protein
MLIQSISVCWAIEDPKQLTLKQKAREGQATTEYVVLLATLVVIILSLGMAFQRKLRDLAEGRIGTYLEQNFFDSNRLHRLPVDLSRKLRGN